MTDTQTQFPHVFSIRPSTHCNLACSYCYRSDELVQKTRQQRFDVAAMVWHAQQKAGSLFNFCGYGETMLHPQFADMVIALTQVTPVNWVTNGTVFGGKAFEAILARANHRNIHNVIISAHFEQLAKRMASFASEVAEAVTALNERGITAHLTSIVTDQNIDAVVALKDELSLPIGFKTTFPQYFQGGKRFTHGYAARTQAILDAHGIEPDQDFRYDPGPFQGRECPNGTRIFEVLHDGRIYDCNYDPERVVIGDINVKAPIRALPAPRRCKVKCPECIPMVRDGFGLLTPPRKPSLWDAVLRLANGSGRDLRG